MKIISFSIEEDVQYMECGIMSTEDEWMHAPRVFPMWVLGLCTRGYMYMNIEDVEYKIMAGDMFLLPPNRLHRGTKMGKEGVAYYWIHFRAPEIDAVQREMDFSETPEGNQHAYLMLHYPLLNIQTAFMVCDYLYSLDYGTQYTGIIRQNVLKVLLYEISNQTLLGYAKKFDQRFVRMLDYIRLNFVSELSAESLAQRFGYNKSYLCRLFKKRVGKTLMNYCAELRINLACQQLIGTDYPVKRIAMECGFANEKYFMRQFKTCMGLTPTAYRNTRLNTKSISR
ncbi:MAG: AraC family transcriptional regulator [Faecousia sp.]